MEERPAGRNPESLAGLLLSLAEEERALLASGDLERLAGLTSQRGEVLAQLKDAVDADRAAGVALSARVTEMAQHLLEVNTATTALVEQALRDNGASMRRLHNGRQVVNYKRQPGQRRTSSVDVGS